MKQTKEKVIVIAKKVMEDIQWPYDTNKVFKTTFTSVDEQIEKWKDLKGFDQIKDKIFAYWDIIIDFPEEENWEGRNVYYVEIRDEDGIPYKVGHRQAKFNIEKDENKKFKIVKI